MTKRKKDVAEPRSWRDVVAIHPAAELFPLMPEAELKTLGEDIKKRGLTASITLWAVGDNETHEEFQLLDGRNRLDAMELVGLQTIEQDEDKKWKIKHWLCNRSQLPGIRAGATVVYLYEYRKGYIPLESKEFRERDIDPYEYVLSVNIHRRHLTSEQKRELIAKLLKAAPEKSDRAIGKMAKADKNTVASVRSEKEARGEIHHVETRTDTRGRKSPARKPKGRIQTVATAETVTPPATVPAPDPKPEAAPAVGANLHAVSLFEDLADTATRADAVVVAHKLHKILSSQHRNKLLTFLADLFSALDDAGPDNVY